MDVGRTTARLRRTFHYPGDEDSADSQPEAMDEQEQQEYIARLVAQNTSHNQSFQRLLLALPLVAAVPYVPSLLQTYTMLFSLLALTSLFSTAFLLYRQPPASSGFPWLDAWARPRTPRPTRPPSETAAADDDQDDEDDAIDGSSYHTIPRTTSRRRRSSFTYVERRSPLETYLPYLNLGLGALLVLMAWAIDRSGKATVWSGMGYLPLLVYSVALLAKVVMASVDPEKELESLKYDFKGA